MDPIRFTITPLGDYAIFYWQGSEPHCCSKIGEWKKFEDTQFGRWESVISIDDLVRLREQLNAIFETMEE